MDDNKMVRIRRKEDLPDVMTMPLVAKTLGCSLMEVFLIMPTTPEGKAKLSKELAKFHAEQALKMVQKLPCPTEQKLELIDAVVEHLRSKQ